MRLLFVHADHLEFEAVTAAGEDPAETDAPMTGRMEDCVVVFATVERADEADLGAVVTNAAAEVRDVADQLNTRRVVLYPSAHLSDDRATPDSAAVVLRDLGTELDGDFEVLRAPVGWYTAVEVAAKGHPLSKLSRRVTPEREAVDGTDTDAETSEWQVAFPSGETRDATEVTDDDRVSDDLRALVEAEIEGETVSETTSEDGRPPHAELLRERGFADYDYNGGADALRWYPRGKLVRDLLAEYVTDLAVEYGAMPVETVPQNDRRDCASQLDVFRNLTLSVDDLPIRFYDPNASHEMHAVPQDLERAKEEFRALAQLIRRTGADLGLDYVPLVRPTRKFYEGNEDWVESFAAALGDPALLELLPEHRRHSSVEVAFATVDQLGDCLEGPAVQLDVESAEQFGVEIATGENGDEEASKDEGARHRPIVHCSPMGGIERAVAALLDRTTDQDAPRLPTWLSPTQVRFVPVGEDHVEYCDSLADDLEAAGVRADVDDRDETVAQRLARAEADWVPYYAVVGNRELESDHDGPFEVTVRGENEEREMDFETLRATVRDDVGDLPSKKRYLPKRVSEYPDFTVDSQ